MRNISALVFLAMTLGACGKDADGDGYKSKEDCDDNNDAVNPGAAEVCDGLDNNCDGSTDEGLSGLWYADADADGFGNPDSEVSACEEPAGYVADNGDCDDGDGTINPGATETDCTDTVDRNCDGILPGEDSDGDGFASCEECDDGDVTAFPGADEVCDGKDNDCDNTIDEDPVDGTTWYRDSDQDGQGVDSEEDNLVACDDPGSYYVAEAGDCDDLDPTSYVGGTEVCDGADNDCNGAPDDDAVDADFFYEDNDGDGFGDDDTLQSSCDTLSNFVDIGGDCNDDPDDGGPDINPDAVEVCNDGLDNDCDGGFAACEFDLSNADQTWLGDDAGDGAGGNVKPAGDVNNDGINDVIVGIDGADPDQDSTGEGSMYVIFGSATGGSWDLDDADVRIDGDDDNEQFGVTIAGAFDFDGDGYDEVAACASQNTTNLSQDGACYLYLGDSLGTGSSLDPDDADGSWIGANKRDYLGGGLSGGGDFNNDGSYAELLIGSGSNDEAASNAGKFYVIDGSAAASTGLDVGDEASASFTGENASDKAGTALAGPGDIDGDGIDDIVAGVRYNAANGSESGAVYIILGGGYTGDFSLSDVDVKVGGAASVDRLGTSIASAADIDGDGTADFMAGAPLADNTGGSSDVGEVYVIYGSTTVSAYDAQTIDTVAGVIFEGSSDINAIGGDSTYGVGHANSADDSDYDYVIGASASGPSSEGAAFVFYGPLTGTVDMDDYDASLWGDAASDYAGANAGFVGDLDGSGDDALFVGATGDNTNGASAGAIYFVYDIGL